ncbi:MAG: fructosamine kinase family protein [Rubricoccaceae bacterium]
MQLPGAVLPDAVRVRVEAVTGAVRVATPLGGGQTAQVLRVNTAQGAFVVKWAAGAAGRTFAAEAAGLRALARAAPPEHLVVPVPVAAEVAAPDAPGVLVLPFVAPGLEGLGERFGRALAALHRAAPPVPEAARPYGFATDTYCGPTPQPNGWMDDWPSFVATRRLGPLRAALAQTGRWPAAWEAPFERLLARLAGLLPARPVPSLVHGDLWSGNAFAARDGRGVLVDPAAYVGDRETDLALMELFGFDGAALAAYREAWPLAPGYAERRAVYQLYHVLNHALLFGAPYAAQAGRMLARY